MTLARFLAAAVVICSALAFAQTPTKTDSDAIQAQAASTSKPATASSSDPWKFIPNQAADPGSGTNPLTRFQIEQWKFHDYDLSKYDTEQPTYLRKPYIQDGLQIDADTTCLKIRSYVVARDSKDSDSTHPVSYSTCQPSSRYQLKTTEIRIQSAGR